MGTISFNEAAELKDKVFIDVRTPSEFKKDHISGAVNIPVLSDDERALVGIIYKNESAEKAIDKGVSFFTKRVPEITKKLRKYEGSNIIAYCWRGGMRSRAFVSFLRSLDFNIFQLDGGYKSFRCHVRESLYAFNISPALFCIYGMTGSGKTDIIQKLAPYGIDLEGLASHRSSIFGHVGLEPRTQKMFENLLLDELKRVDGFSHIFIEGESKRIGNINLPDVIFKKMGLSNVIKVSSSLTVRVKRIVGEYFDSDEKVGQIKQVLDSFHLKNKIGKKNVDYLKECLKDGDFESLVTVLLEKYYDPLYIHSQKILKDFVSFESDCIDDAACEIAKYAKLKKLLR